MARTGECPTERQGNNIAHGAEDLLAIGPHIHTHKVQLTGDMNIISIL